MRIWLLASLMSLLGACAAPAVRCDARLTAINEPRGAASVPENNLPGAP